MRFLIHLVLMAVAFLAGIYVGVEYPHHAAEINDQTMKVTPKIEAMTTAAAAKAKIEVYQALLHETSGSDQASADKRAQYQAQIQQQQAQLDAANAQVATPTASQ